MKKITIICLTLSLCFRGYSQTTISRQVFAAAGQSTNTMDYTIGEPLTNTLVGVRNTFTQGFHQPDLLVINTDNFAAAYSVVLFPNPCTQFFSLKTNNLDEKLSLEILDLNGKSLLLQHNMLNNSLISTEILPAGTYFAVFKNAKNEMIAKSKFIKVTE